MVQLYLFSLDCYYVLRENAERRQCQKMPIGRHLERRYRFRLCSGMPAFRKTVRLQGSAAAVHHTVRYLVLSTVEKSQGFVQIDLTVMYCVEKIRDLLLYCSSSYCVMDMFAVDF